MYIQELDADASSPRAMLISALLIPHSGMQLGCR